MVSLIYTSGTLVDLARRQGPLSLSLCGSLSPCGQLEFCCMAAGFQEQAFQSCHSLRAQPQKLNVLFHLFYRSKQESRLSCDKGWGKRWYTAEEPMGWTILQKRDLPQNPFPGELEPAPSTTTTPQLESEETEALREVPCVHSSKHIHIERSSSIWLFLTHA